MVLFIEDPDIKRIDGKHFTLKYEIPRNTTRIDVKTIQPKDASQVEASNQSDSDEIESHQSYESNHDNMELEDLASKEIKFNEHEKRTWCDKNDQNVSDEQIHENNDEQPRSRFNFKCQLKDQVIVNDDYTQVLPKISNSTIINNDNG
jgi:hypothetical protein